MQYGSLIENPQTKLLVNNAYMHYKRKCNLTHSTELKSSQAYATALKHQPYSVTFAPITWLPL